MWIRPRNYSTACTPRAIVLCSVGSLTFNPSHFSHTPSCARYFCAEAVDPPRSGLTARDAPRATGVEGAGGPRRIPGCLRAAAGPGRASRSTTPSRRLACGDLAGGPPPSGTKTGSPGPEGTVNPSGERAGPTAPGTPATQPAGVPVTQPRPRRYKTRARHSTEYRARSRL